MTCWGAAGSAANRRICWSFIDWLLSASAMLGHVARRRRDVLWIAATGMSHAAPTTGHPAAAAHHHHDKRDDRERRQHAVPIHGSVSSERGPVYRPFCT